MLTPGKCPPQALLEQSSENLRPRQCPDKPVHLLSVITVKEALHGCISRDAGQTQSSRGGFWPFSIPGTV